MAHAIRILGHNGLIHPDAGVVVDISGFGHADNGVDEHVGLALTRGADGELAVSAVHRVTGLESDDLAPSNLLEVGTELSGCIWMQRLQASF